MIKDTVYEESLDVDGSILGKDGNRYDLKVNGNINCIHHINCRNINCHNIDCINIDCHSIDCHSIDCHNIVCHSINAWNIDADGIITHKISTYGNINCNNISACKIEASFIICESIKQKEGSKLIARHILVKRSKYEWKEQKL